LNWGVEKWGLEDRDVEEESRLKALTVSHKADRGSRDSLKRFIVEFYAFRRKQ